MEEVKKIAEFCSWIIRDAEERKKDSGAVSAGLWEARKFTASEILARIQDMQMAKKSGKQKRLF